MGDAVLRYEFTTADGGTLSWTPSAEAQAHILAWTAEHQAEARRLITAHLEVAARSICACAVSGPAFAALMTILTGAIGLGGQRALEVMGQVMSGALPACGIATCTECPRVSQS
jgi:hypothetical protein